MKRTLLTLGKIALSVGLLTWIILSLDRAQLVGAIQRLDPASVAFAAVLVTLQAVIIGWRWHRLVTMLGGNLSGRRAVRWVFVGMFFNNLMPTSVGGDVMRIWLLRGSGAPLRTAIGSVVIERSTGIVLLGLLITACMPVLWAEMANQQALRLLLVGIGPLLLVCLALAAIGDRLLPKWLPASVAHLLGGLGEGLRLIVARPRWGAEVAMLGIIASLAGLIAAWVLGEGLGINRGLATYIAVVGGSVLLSVLPVSLGGWGVRELGMVALFGAMDVLPEQALALSLVWGLLPLVVSLPGALMWWLHRPEVTDQLVAQTRHGSP